jgi:hypothetical protein
MEGLIFALMIECEKIRRRMGWHRLTVWVGINKVGIEGGFAL